MSKEFSENIKNPKREATQEDRINFVRKLLHLIGKDEELQSFLRRGNLGKPQQGDAPDSFYMLSGITDGARIVGLGKQGGQFVAYLSGGTHEKMLPIEIKDQAEAESLIAEVNKFL